MKKMALAIVLTTIFLSSGICPAQAHGELVTTYPKVNARLDQAPHYVELVFDGNLLTMGKTEVNLLEVKDATGARLDDGNAITSGAKLKVGLLKVKISGAISVRWRVTSEDGHPVDGGFIFSVGPTITATPSTTQIVPAVQQKGLLHQLSLYILLLVVALSMAGVFVARKVQRHEGRE